MPVLVGDTLIKTSMVLDRKQLTLAKQLAATRSTKHTTVSASAVLREAIDAGFSVILRAPSSDIVASETTSEKAA